MQNKEQNGKPLTRKWSERDMSREGTASIRPGNPFGFMAFYRGLGLGVRCIPIGPFYLTWKAKEFDHSTRFIELASEINTAISVHFVDRIGESLNSARKPLNGSWLLVLGLVYKPNVDDERESLSRIIELIKHRGAETTYYDPHAPIIHPTREHPHLAGTRSVNWDQVPIAGFDDDVVATAHAGMNYQELADWVPCIVDARNSMATVQVAPGEVWKASAPQTGTLVGFARRVTVRNRIERKFG